MLISYLFVIKYICSYNIPDEYTIYKVSMVIQEETGTDMADMENDTTSEWEPDEAALTDPENYQVHTWDKTYLGIP